VAGELAIFAGAGFREDTRPEGPRAFVLECDWMLGVSQLWEAENLPDGTTGFSPFATFYPLDQHVALGIRFATAWELLLSEDLALGGVWKE